MNRKSAWLGVLLVLGVVSCGGEGDGLAGGRDGSGGTGGTGGTTVVSMGSTSGDSFQEGVLGVSTTNLSSGGSTTLTAQLRDQDGASYTESVTVSFSSDCLSSGLAEIEEPSVTTTTGTATTTYIAQGCSGTDTVTARATANGQSLSAAAALNVEAAELGSIEFVSATPQTIGLRGTGAAGIKETAVVKFRVANEVGGPVPDQEVAFDLSTEVGGLSLTPATAITGSDGTASVTVRAGTIPTAVRVEATVVDTNISTQSSALTVTTAIPDQNSFSLSASTYNPEAWMFDNVEVELSVLAADRFNNLVPDDTAIVFTTELGAIVAQCLTIDGACSATWRSQAPRLDFSGGDTGRTTVIAHAVGEESFQDADGNGVFDGSTTCPGGGGADCFYDLAEAFLDENENGMWDAPNEDFMDFNSNNSYDAANGEWDGIVCGSGGSCQANLVNVRSSVVLVMARTFADIYIFDGAGNLITGSSPAVPTGQTITVCIVGDGTLDPASPATLADVLAAKAQTMPEGTTIEFATEVGTMGGKTDFAVPNTNSEIPLCIPKYVAGAASGENGLFEVTVVPPSGVVNESYASFLMTDP